jgi:hypothetical protein
MQVMLNKMWYIFQFKINLFSSTDTNIDAEYKILRNSFKWELSFYIHIEKQIHTTKLIVDFHNVSRAPNNMNAMRKLYLWVTLIAVTN